MKRIILSFMPALFVALAWELLVRGDSRLTFLFASPSLILGAGFEELIGGTLLGDTLLTTAEALTGLGIGSVLGTIAGLLLWIDPRVARIARPYVVVLGSIPIFAIAPMLIIWFGTGFLSKVVMAAFAVFFIALAQAYEGARHCGNEHGSLATSLAAPRGAVLRKIIVPGAMRWVSAGLRLNIGISFVGAFIGEFVSSNAGLGHFILRSGSLYDMPRVLLGVAVIALVSLGATGVVALCEARWPRYFAT